MVVCNCEKLTWLYLKFSFPPRDGVCLDPAQSVANLPHISSGRPHNQNHSTAYMFFFFLLFLSPCQRQDVTFERSNAKEALIHLQWANFWELNVLNLIHKFFNHALLQHQPSSLQDIIHPLYARRSHNHKYVCPFIALCFLLSHYPLFLWVLWEWN